MSTSAESDVEQSEPLPLLIVRGLGLRTSQGWSYRGVDLTLPERAVHAVVGRRGSGRSSLLLALTGRMASSAGTVTLDGSTDPRRLRAQTAVARIGELVDLEPRHTVAEALAERCLMDDVPHRDGARRFADAARLLDLSVEPRGLVEELTGRDVTRLAVALACVRSSHLIVLDDLERDLDSAEQTELLRRLQDLAAEGPTIVVATVDQRPVDEAAVASTTLLRSEPSDIARPAVLPEPAATPSPGDSASDDPPSGDPAVDDPPSDDRASDAPPDGGTEAGSPPDGDPSTGFTAAGDPADGDPAAGDPAAGDLATRDTASSDRTALDDGALDTAQHGRHEAPETTEQGDAR